MLCSLQLYAVVRWISPPWKEIIPMPTINTCGSKFNFELCLCSASWRTSWTVITHRCQYKNNKAASVKAQGRFFSGHKDSYFLPQENERQVLRVKVIFSLVYLLWKWIKWSEIHASNQLTSTCHYCTFSRKEKYCETTTCTMESLLLQYVF